jgi:hypothetical protein
MLSTQMFDSNKAFKIKFQLWKKSKVHNLINFPHKIKFTENIFPEHIQGCSRSIFCYRTGSMKDSWAFKIIKLVCCMLFL